MSSLVNVEERIQVAGESSHSLFVLGVSIRKNLILRNFMNVRI